MSINASSDAISNKISSRPTGNTDTSGLHSRIYPKNGTLKNNNLKQLKKVVSLILKINYLNVLLIVPNKKSENPVSTHEVM